MKTFPILDNASNLVGFEIAAYPLTIRSLRSRIGKQPGFEVIFKPGQDRRLAFRYQEFDFEVMEPWGDNSRYWVGLIDNKPDSLQSSNALQRVLDTFNEF
jgi:hypothetical protein